MARRVSLDEETYQKLVAIRREGETFGDLIRRLLARRPSLLEFAGTLSKEDAEDVERVLQTMRNLDRERQARILERLK